MAHSAAVSRLPPSYRTVLDPGAGDGRLAASALTHCKPHICKVTAVELHEGRAEMLPSEWDVVCGGYLGWAEKMAGHRTFDLIISNPPFSEWIEFVDASFPLLAPRGTLLVLGFSNILGSQKRAGWWRRHKPSSILQSPRRPQFIPDSSNGDPRESIWVQWGPGRPKHTRFDWL